MGNRALFVRVGLLLLFGIGAGLAMVLLLSRSTISNGARYEAYFQESVQGLDVGSPVKFRGVTLGQVTFIGLVTAAYARDQNADLNSAAYRDVLVRFIVAPDRLGKVPSTEDAIRLGLRARLASQGLTGLAYLELDFVDPARYPVEPIPWTPLYPFIPSIPSTIIQLQDAAQSLLGNITRIDPDRLAASSQAVLDELRALLGASGDVHQLLVAATATLGALHTAVEQSDVPGLAVDLHGTAESVRRLADGPQTRQLLASSTRAADDLAEAAKRLPPLIAALEATVKQAKNGTADLQADLAPVLRDARAAVSNLREATDTLRRNPASVLLGAPPPRPPAR